MDIRKTVNTWNIKDTVQTSGQSCSGTQYSRMSCTGQSRIKQRVSRVFVVMASPCFMRYSVFADNPCLKISSYSVTPFLKRVS